MALKGQRFHGEVVSANATAGVAFLLYLEGEIAAYALAAGEQLVVTDLAFSPAVAMTVTVAADADAAGKRIAKQYCAATGGQARPLATPHVCPAGVVPKLFGSVADNVAAVIHGLVMRP